MQALWMLLAAFSFASMGVGVKIASHSFSAAELVCYRGMVSTLFMALVVWSRGQSLRTRYPSMHLWRALVGVISLGGWFYAIGQLPLATAMTLNYMSGVWIAAFVLGGALLYGSAGQALRQGPLLLAVLVGFGGVTLVLHPTVAQNQVFAGVVGLLSGISAALAYMQVTALGKIGEPEERTVFYFALACAVVGGVAAWLTGFTPWDKVSWQAAAWLIPIGLLASIGQWCMTRAYSHGATLVVANLQYSGIVFAAIYSLILFGDQIDSSAWLGIALIVVSGIAATVLRSRALPNTPAEEH